MGPVRRPRLFPAAFDDTSPRTAVQHDGPIRPHRVFVTIRA
jgi:hypothetical protein